MNNIIPTPYDFGHSTFDQVVERINEGSLQGFEEYTSEFLAASYALSALQCKKGVDSTEEIKSEIIFHLEILSDGGVMFDQKATRFITFQLFQNLS